MNKIDMKNEMIELILQNPDLRVIPMVSTLIDFDNDCDNSDRFESCIGNSYIDEILVNNEKIYSKSLYDMNDLMFDIVGEDIYNKLSEENLMRMYELLPWEKVIIVNIDEI